MIIWEWGWTYLRRVISLSSLGLLWVLYQLGSQKFMCYRCKLKHRFSKLKVGYLQSPSLGIEGKSPSSIGEFNNKNLACFGKQDRSLGGNHIHLLKNILAHLHLISLFSWFLPRAGNGSWISLCYWASSVFPFPFPKALS